MYEDDSTRAIEFYKIVVVIKPIYLSTEPHCLDLIVPRPAHPSNQGILRFE